MDKNNLGPEGANFDGKGTHFMTLYIALIAEPRVTGRLKDLEGIDQRVVEEAKRRGLPILHALDIDGREIDVEYPLQAHVVVTGQPERVYEREGCPEEPWLGQS